MKKYLTSKIKKKNVPHVFFSLLQFYESPDLSSKIFKTWNVRKSEAKAKSKSEVRLPIWPENAKFSVKMQLFTFLTPLQKSVVKLMTNFKFNFSESGPRSVHIPPKLIFLFDFSNFNRTIIIHKIFGSNSTFHVK